MRNTVRVINTTLCARRIINMQGRWWWAFIFLNLLQMVLEMLWLSVRPTIKLGFLSVAELCKVRAPIRSCVKRYRDTFDENFIFCNVGTTTTTHVLCVCLLSSLNYIIFILRCYNSYRITVSNNTVVYKALKIVT